MCIRDSVHAVPSSGNVFSSNAAMATAPSHAICEVIVCETCLLYTSDAADERSSVDLGGRRIIKKKTNIYSVGQWSTV